MIEMKMDKGACVITMKGPRFKLLAEIPIGFDKILKELLDDAPAGLRDKLIKTIFELTLREFMEKEDDEE